MDRPLHASVLQIFLAHHRLWKRGRLSLSKGSFILAILHNSCKFQGASSWCESCSDGVRMLWQAFGRHAIS